MSDHPIIIGIFSFVLIFGLCLTSAEAQDGTNNVGLGGQIGEPTGVTLKLYDPNGMSYDLLAAFDLNDFFYFNVHGQFERQIADDEPLHVFYGPGAFIGIYDRPRGADDDIALGISGRIGLNFYIERFELFAQVTPRIEIIPATDGDVGGGLGFRFYF